MGDPWVRREVIGNANEYETEREDAMTDPEILRLAREIIARGGDFPHKYAAEVACLKLAAEIIRIGNFESAAKPTLDAATMDSATSGETPRPTGSLQGTRRQSAEAADSAE